MPRPGFVLDVDRSTPPILFHHGEGFRLERLPAGRSRVIYPAEPLEALKNPDQAIRDALEHFDLALRQVEWTRHGSCLTLQ